MFGMAVMCSLFGLSDCVLMLAQLLAAYVDVCTHEWYHTPSYLYAQQSKKGGIFGVLNFFHPKWFGVNVFFRSIEKLGFVNKALHNRVHHLENAENNHLTEDWIDFCPPGLLKLHDAIAVFCFWLGKKVIAAFRGHARAEPVPGLTKRACKRTHLLLSLLLAVLFSAQFVFSHKLAGRIFPASCGAEGVRSISEVLGWPVALSWILMVGRLALGVLEKKLYGFSWNSLTAGNKEVEEDEEEKKIQ